ncbi:hypothetical protein ACGF1Z_35555 [Streptomyces sp. NPDC048018]|uniref:hypothetical protein n=1 Tax=Streptomyces sp. NPDC048018 TaxID=3365499 RepID=UPI0037224763
MAVADTSVLFGILGPGPWLNGLDLGGIEEAWGFTLPDEVKQISALYGDTLIDEFLFIYGPSTMEEKGRWMSRYVQEGNSRLIVDPVLPHSGGMLYWGHTVEGDQLFLVPQDDKTTWTVSAFRRSWGDWHSTNLDLISWLEGVFRGEIETDWLPEWPERHTFERLR